MDRRKRLALVLSGGAARGAFQAGALKALAEICREDGIERPFPIITGVSAGAINAAFLGALADDFYKATHELANFWSKITLDEVFRTDIRSLSSIGWGWMSDVVMGGGADMRRVRSLLDTSPLVDFLGRRIEFDRIAKNLQSGAFDALAVSATDYASGENVSFVQSREPFTAWQRARRNSVACNIELEHISASAAIPLFFPPVKVHGRYFGDGCLRNTTPLSPAIHLQADALLVIGVQYSPHQPIAEELALGSQAPSIARILSTLLNSVMLDGVAIDIERLKRINQTLQLIPAEQAATSALRVVECLDINPSQNISEIADRAFHRLPRAVRYLLTGLGSRQDVSTLVSYLLFDPVYCQRLLDLGYEDLMLQKAAIRKLFI